MSRNRTNYNNYSKEENVETAEVVETIEPEVEETVEEVVEEKVEETVEEVVEEVVEDVKAEVTTGIVTAGKLYIRETPFKVSNANVKCIVKEGDELAVYVDESTVDWYKVTTKTGVTGFCIKKFVELR